MLDAFIIEQIKKRERAEEAQRPTLELPLPPEREPNLERDRGGQQKSTEDDADKRGVFIIDFGA